MYSRVEYAIRTTRISGCRAVIVGRPGPLNDVAGPDANRAGIKVSPALSDGHVRRRRASEEWKEDDETGEQSDMHWVDYFESNLEPQTSTKNAALNRSLWQKRPRSRPHDRRVSAVDEAVGVHVGTEICRIARLTRAIARLQ